MAFVVNGVLCLDKWRLDKWGLLFMAFGVWINVDWCLVFGVWCLDKWRLLLMAFG